MCCLVTSSTFFIECLLAHSMNKLTLRRFSFSVRNFQSARLSSHHSSRTSLTGCTAFSYTVVIGIVDISEPPSKTINKASSTKRSRYDLRTFLKLSNGRKLFDSYILNGQFCALNFAISGSRVLRLTDNVRLLSFFLQR